MSKEGKEKQIRLTLEDCITYQDKLRDLLKILISENRSVTHHEKQQLYKTMPKALLTQGTTQPVTMVIKRGWFIFASIQNFILRTSEMTTGKVRLETTRPEEVTVDVPISDLWKFIFDRVMYLFPLAAAEAIHLSGESPARTEQGVYSFSSTKKLEERSV